MLMRDRKSDSIDCLQLSDTETRDDEKNDAISKKAAFSVYA